MLTHDPTGDRGDEAPGVPMPLPARPVTTTRRQRVMEALRAGERRYADLVRAAEGRHDRGHTLKVLRRLVAVGIVVRVARGEWVLAESGARKPVSRTEATLSALRLRGRATVAELAQDTGYPRNRVANYLWMLMQDRHVVRVSRATYEVPT